MDALTDEALMQQIQAGNLQHLELLVRRYERPLFGYAQRLLGAAGGADDAFQETFLRVFQKRSSFREGALFRPWVYQICLNICRDLLRKRGRRPESALNDDQIVIDPDLRPDQSSENQQLGTHIRQAVLELPEKQRDVFLLHHYQSLSYPEISEILQVPVGTVKSRMFHATRALAERLQDWRPTA